MGDESPACVLPDETSESGEDPPLDLGDEGGCGNGVVEGDELCDDGNAIAGDGCEIDCTLSDDVPAEFQFGLGGPTGFPDCGTGVAFDSEGNLILGAYSEEQIWLRKYDVEYEEQWTVTYPGKPGGGSCYVKVAVDSEDNIAFAGPTGVLDNADWLFGLLDPEGTEIWTDTMDGPIQRHDFPRGIAVDSEDNLIIVGMRENPFNASEAAILKYTHDGTMLWSSFVSGGNGQGDLVLAVATDPCDAVVVAAGQFSNGTGLDAVVRKYDATGGLLWERFNTTPAYDWAMGIGVDAWGDVVAAGAQVDSDPNYFDFWMRKYSADGTELWTVLEDGGAQQTDLLNDSFTSPGGDTWAAGVITTVSGGEQAVLRRYGSDGQVRWTRLLDLGGQDGWLSVGRAPDHRIGVGGVYSLPFPFDTEAQFAVYPP